MKPKKKIAFLLKMFPRFAETFILNEILELERQGVSLLLISLKRPNESCQQAKVDRVKSKVVYVPEPIRITLLLLMRNLRPMFLVLRANLQLYKADPERYKRALAVCWRLKDRKAKKRFLVAGYIAQMLLEAGFEHLHAHFANDPASVARFVHLLSGISYSFTAHAKDIYLSDEQALQDKIHEAKFVITCTHYNRSYLQKISRNGTPIHTIYHGFDESIFANGCCPKQPANPDSASTRPLPLILSVGRLVEKKGFDCLIAACHLLLHWEVPFRCQIVGEGPLEARLRNDINRFGLEKQVEILAFIPQERLVHKYFEADLFAVPCQISGNGDRDGIPNVLVEAMATGLPVVATRVSGLAEVVEPAENGFLVPARNPRALAEA
ncbi:MAG: glycosyltransferase, partial [bacterium]